MDDMEKKDISVPETSSKSPEIRAFFDLVDRAHSLQLLSEKNNQGSEKPLRNNFSVWKPSFEPEDFNLPPKSGSTSTVDPPLTMAAAGDEGKDEENRLKRGLKRPRQFLDLAPLFVVSGEGLKRGDTSKVLLCDLNKEAEPSEGVDGGTGLALNLELGTVRK
ncbi:uncharacterized protein LOC122094358 [Macadamia integrifolia]|uniref:uncharacterized protein LOC122094358 n=1 Tax=Macadamia integrifolia TaxID=60698 RepID=UPI001C52850D|nr:uncharacterized protein LOC122094358 [Macadamia integrifolia]XP_042521063.1 uncharacterized protein LOC122094358 [Macadamia integrifolia]